MLLGETRDGALRLNERDGAERGAFAVEIGFRRKVSPRRCVPPHLSRSHLVNPHVLAHPKSPFARVGVVRNPAPFVATVIAAASRDGRLEPGALKKLEANAEDLGERGRDPVYGFGLIREPGD